NVEGVMNSDKRVMAGKGEDIQYLSVLNVAGPLVFFLSSVVGSRGVSINSGWGVTNDCRLDTPAACQDTMDHIAPPGYFSELRHLPNADFRSQYNMNLTRQVAVGSQLRLRFEQETKNLETLLEAEADMKKAAEAKNAELVEIIDLKRQNK
ncbi:hypothetical protein Tco_1256940, partial [Tanacetum coccineum]